jgi:hypothetical protein
LEEALIVVEKAIYVGLLSEVEVYRQIQLSSFTQSFLRRISCESELFTQTMGGIGGREGLQTFAIKIWLRKAADLVLAD